MDRNKHNDHKIRVKLVSLDKLILTPFGSVTPRCQTCHTADCGYRIEYRTISVFGVNKRIRCLINGTTPSIVADCEGYTD